MIKRNSNLGHRTSPEKNTYIGMGRSIELMEVLQFGKELDNPY